MQTPILKFFEYKHLPENLQRIAKPFCVLANDFDELFVDSAEKSAGLRKLLEAKDCMVRAGLDHTFAVMGNTGSGA